MRKWIFIMGKIMNSTKLNIGAKFSLFVVSFLPLFLLLVFLQFYRGNINISHPELCGSFLLPQIFSSVLLLVSLVGVLGLFLTINNMKRRVFKDGFTGKIIEIENKNSDVILYLFTYLALLSFSDMSKTDNVVILSTFLIITYRIYVNSNMLIVNPVLGFFKYSIYQVSYENNGVARKGMIITSSSDLNINVCLNMLDLDKNLFYVEVANG